MFRKSCTLFVSSLALVLASLSIWAEQKSIETPTDQLANLIQNLRSYQANFKQKVIDEFGSVLDESQGSFSLQKPNHFRWEVTEQFPQLIVADGEHMWTYDIELEQVTVQNQAEVTQGSPLALLTSDAKALAKSFDISLASEAQSKRVFALSPKSEQSVFESVNILFDGDKLTELFLVDSLGQNTVVQFSDVKVNQKVEPALFSFQIPPDVDLIDSRVSVKSIRENP